MRESLLECVEAGCGEGATTGDMGNRRNVFAVILWEGVVTNKMH